MRLGINGPNGSGKSLLARQLAALFGYELIKEPIENNEYLSFFYENKDLFSYLGQNAFYAAMFTLMWTHKDQKDVIFDSTFYSNIIYTKLLHLEGYMNEHQYQLSLEIAKEHISHLPKLDLEIVIRRPKNVLFQNVHHRNREMEQGQDNYLSFHFDNFYLVAQEVYREFSISQDNILIIEAGDLKDLNEISRIAGLIETRYNQIKEKE